MLENEPNDREFNDGSGGSESGAVSAGASRGGVSSRPVGPPDPVTPEPRVPGASTLPGTPAATGPGSSGPTVAPPSGPAAPGAPAPAVSFQPPQVLFQPPAATTPPPVSSPGQATPAPAPDSEADDEGGARRPSTRRRSGGRAKTATDDAPPASRTGGNGGRRAGGSAAAAGGDADDRADTASSRPAGPPAGATEPDAPAAPGALNGPDDEADDGSEDGGPSGRRRRRRGGRSRTRARGGADDSGAEEGDADSAAESGGSPAGRSRSGAHASESESADADLDDQDGDEDDDETGGAQGRRRRRKRRRGSVGDSERTGTEDDPPDTVVHVREARSAASRTADDDVRSVKGSTRLEAKRQRRREGRESGRRRPPVVTEAEFLARREAVERTMVVRQRGDRTQIAVLEDGILVEHYVNRTSHQSYVGNVYLGKVQNVLPSMEAAFVDIGKGRNAVLYAGEVNFDASGLEGQSKRIESALKSGQSILVQVTKDPVGHKGARLTSQVSLPGRYLVYVPGASMTGISRKLPDTERTRLKKILKKVMPEDAGVIVRTAAEGAAEEELDRDVARLAAQWENIERKAKTASAPELLYGEPDLTVRVIRDVFNEDFSELIVSGDGAWDEVDEYVRYVAPHLADRLTVWDDASGRDAFAEYHVDEQLAKALERKVWLPSGGSLVIDRTEAMTVVDVNTGKFTGQGGNLEETVTRNNLEAAEEIVRQLRLRDVGGIIVIDFIDMVLESNRELVLRRLLECLARDRTKHQVAEVTSLGLVQMTRKRVGAGLLEAFSVPCECCNGRGVHVSLDLADLGQSGPVCQQGGSAGSHTHSRGGGRDSKPNGNGNGGGTAQGGDGGHGGQTGNGGNGGQAGHGASGGGRKGRDSRRRSGRAATTDEATVSEPAVSDAIGSESALSDPAAGAAAAAGEIRADVTLAPADVTPAPSDVSPSPADISVTPSADVTPVHVTPAPMDVAPTPDVIPTPDVADAADVAPKGAAPHPHGAQPPAPEVHTP
jgi:ribonuclease E